MRISVYPFHSGAHFFSNKIHSLLTFNPLRRLTANLPSTITTPLSPSLRLAFFLYYSDTRGSVCAQLPRRSLTWRIVRTREPSLTVHARGIIALKGSLSLSLWYRSVAREGIMRPFVLAALVVVELQVKGCFVGVWWEVLKVWGSIFSCYCCEWK